MLFSPRFIYRQITSSLKQTIVFVLCVALSLVTLVSLGGFGESVNNSLLRDARQLLAADVVIESSFPFTEEMQAELDAVAAEDGIALARTYEFISVVRLVEGEETLLSELKVVDPGYPFYGEVGLASQRPLAEVLTPGNIAVGQNLLDRLGLAVGDSLRVGAATLTIADVVSGEPDQPVDFFTLGPRILVAAADIPAIDLIKPGSRVQYKALLQVTDESLVDGVEARLEEVAEPRQERVSTFRNNQSTVQRFFEDFLTFLSLIGIFTLMLAGIGIQSSLSAFLKERESTIAILRTFGATSSFVLRQYFAVATILGLIGVVIGLLLGLGLQLLFPVIFAPFLPPRVEFILSARSIVEGLLLGGFVVLAFTFIPVYQVQELKPHFIFRKESFPLAKGWPFWVALGAILLFFSGMVYWYLRNPERTVYFAGGAVGLVALTAVLTQGVLFLLRRRTLRRLDLRQALRGLFRPRNATAAIIVTLSASLAVLFTIYLIERNLDASFVEAFPEDAPNIFILDIQPDQREAIVAELGAETQLIPVIQGRLRVINGEPVPERPAGDGPPAPGGPPGGGEPGQDNNGDGRGQRVTDLFTLTYGNGVLAGEEVLAGLPLFESEDPGIAQVSVLDRFLEVYPFEIGDVVQFEIQGVPLEARIVSFRRVTNEDDFTPHFTFVMREQDLLNAPQTILTAATLPDDEIAAFQNRIVGQYPNITVVNITQAVDTVAEVVANITVIIRFFTLFSIIAGLLIIVSSVLATRFARIQEAVYFKVLGAKRRFVLRVFALENVFIGLLSALLALFLSQLTAYLLIVYVFELDYVPYWGSSIGLVLFTVALVTGVGLLASTSILQKKPITFLREQTAE